MFFTRKIGKLIRGNTTPFQVYAAALLGAFIGFTPGFDHSPGLILFWSFLLLILNANLFLAGLVGLLSKVIYLVTLPIAFQIGRILIDGPTQGLFAGLHNGPITAYFGLDYYVVPGGQVLALIVGLAFGYAFSGGLKKYRNKMAKRESEREGPSEKKAWLKTVEFIFVGSKSSKSYEDLLARKIGNPIRIVGVIIVVVFGGILYGATILFSDAVIATMARDGLSNANGATVDLESADLNLDEGKLELVGIAFADPNSLETDILRAKRIVADVSAADILRKRFSIDKLVVDTATSGETRSSPGKHVGPRYDSEQKPVLEMPDFNDLDSMIENAKVWKERLAQVRRWLDRISPAKPDILETPGKWEEELASRIRAVGYANVRSEMLTQDSPLVLIRNLEAFGVATKQLEGKLIDIEGNNLSTHPHLVAESPSISIKSQDGILSAALSLGLAAGRDKNDLNFEYKEIPTSALASTIQADGKPLLEGGTIDFKITGDLNAVDSDLLGEANFKNVNLMVAGSQVNLNGMDLPLNIRGPIDSPSIKMDTNFLQSALKQAGKKKLLEAAGEELGIDLGDDTSSEGLKDAAESLLGGFLNRKKDEEKE